MPAMPVLCHKAAPEVEPSFCLQSFGSGQPVRLPGPSLLSKLGALLDMRLAEQI